MLDNYLVIYTEYQVEGVFGFSCQADSFSHAEEQFVNAYPEDIYIIDQISKENIELDNDLYVAEDRPIY